MRQLELWSDLGAVPPCNAASVAAEAIAPAPPAPRLEGAGDVSLLAARLAGLLGRRLHLTLTDNRRTMVSYRERHGIVRLRVHRMFLRAGERELTALAAYVAGVPEGQAVLDAFIAAHERERPVEPAACQPRGRFHDLAEIHRELNERFFHNAVAARITWGTASRRRYRRSIQLGSYVRDERLIRIHPCLDQAFVPRHYVAWIVFHEMLHDVFGVEIGRRRRVHPPEFSVCEQSYPDFLRCKEWEQANMHRLLRYRS